jgi:hypothetical protein
MLKGFSQQQSPSSYELMDRSPQIENILEDKKHLDFIEALNERIDSESKCNYHKVLSKDELSRTQTFQKIFKCFPLLP